MALEPDPPDPSNPIDGNKNETELPIGEAQDVEAREHAMWRCGNCGEMGELEEMLPEFCPSCTAPREELFYWEED